MQLYQQYKVCLFNGRITLPQCVVLISALCTCTLHVSIDLVVVRRTGYNQRLISELNKTSVIVRHMRRASSCARSINVILIYMYLWPY